MVLVVSLCADFPDPFEFLDPTDVREAPLCEDAFPVLLLLWYPGAGEPSLPRDWSLGVFRPVCRPRSPPPPPLLALTFALGWELELDLGGAGAAPSVGR